MKTKWSDTKNILDGFSSKLDLSKEKVSKHEETVETEK